LSRGDVARLVTGVGGGYGDRFRRDPELVRQDVKAEVLTAAEARRLYGVVLDPVTVGVDEAGTEALREEMTGRR
jgi:N-methylhydantoinase B